MTEDFNQNSDTQANTKSTKDLAEKLKEVKRSESKQSLQTTTNLGEQKQSQSLESTAAKTPSASEKRNSAIKSEIGSVAHRINTAGKTVLDSLRTIIENLKGSSSDPEIQALVQQLWHDLRFEVSTSTEKEQEQEQYKLKALAVDRAPDIDTLLQNINKGVEALIDFLSDLGEETGLLVEVEYEGKQEQQSLGDFAKDERRASSFKIVENPQKATTPKQKDDAIKKFTAAVKKPMQNIKKNCDKLTLASESKKPDVEQQKTEEKTAKVSDLASSLLSFLSSKGINPEPQTVTSQVSAESLQRAAENSRIR